MIELLQLIDNEASEECRRLYPDKAQLELVNSKDKALQGADALVICTEWQHFRAPDFGLIRSTLNNPVIFDGRNLYDPAQMTALGITYYGIGRGESVKIP